jgi:cell wall-associated NlpC family hydrolase
MKRNLLGVIFVGLAAVGILTIANAQNNIDNASAAETVDFDSIIAQSDINDDNNDITDIDTQELGLLGADVFSLDEIETAAEEAVEIYTENDDDNEYADLAIANVTNYVNVRSNPNTDSEIVGKIYNGAVAQVLSTAGDNNDWFQIVSGNVEGYIKSEFFIYGEDAAEVIDNYVTRYAVVIADRLNVREESSTDAKRIGYIDNGEKVKIVENQGEWLKVEYTTDKIGYIATEYVNITEEFVYAKTIAEEQAELAAIKALEEREKVSEETASENVTITVTPPSTNYSSNSELRNSIVEYSMQFLGNKYVHGGQSLVTGTDCSGFTSLIYKEFGYSVSRTPACQLSSNGRSISYSEIQPGDIICYGSSGKCTHVALYIGNGQIIHSANSKKGVIISSATYDTILGVKNIID